MQAMNSLTTTGIGNQVELRKCNDEQLKQPIRFAMTIVGLKPESAPEGLEKGVLLQFIRNNFPDFTSPEISFAFQKAMAREIPGLDAKCYGTFSAEYVGRILGTYRDWKPVDPEFEKTESIYFWRAYIQLQYKRFLSEGEQGRAYAFRMYTQLTSDKKIKPRTNRAYFTDKFIRDYFTYLSEKGRSEVYSVEELTLDQLNKKVEWAEKNKMVY
jgi:hypothetical protein